MSVLFGFSILLFFVLILNAVYQTRKGFNNENCVPDKILKNSGKVEGKTNFEKFCDSLQKFREQKGKYWVRSEFHNHLKSNK